MCTYTSRNDTNESAEVVLLASEMTITSLNSEDSNLNVGTNIDRLDFGIPIYVPFLL